MVLIISEWILPIHSKPIVNGAIAVKHGEIIDIGPSAELVPKYPKARIEDLGSSIVLPGFVDVHTHLDNAVLRGMCGDQAYVDWKLRHAAQSAKLSDHDQKVSARLGVLRAISSGVTSVSDTSDKPHSLKAADEIGLRGLFNIEISGVDPKETENIVKQARHDHKAWSAAAVSGLTSVGLAPHSTYTVSPDLLQEVANWSISEQIPVAMHIAGSKDEYEFVKYGASRLAGEYWELRGWDRVLWQPMGTGPVRYISRWKILDADITGVHLIHVDPEDIDILQAHNVKVAYCPRMSAKLGLGVAPLERFFTAGLTVGIGTDSPASSESLDFFDEMRTGLLVQRAVTGNVSLFTAERFVRMATSDGAKILGLSDRVGALEIGKRADLIAVDVSQKIHVVAEDPYSALVYNATQRDVRYVMIDGKELVKNFQLHGHDITELDSDVMKIKAKVAKRS